MADLGAGRPTWVCRNGRWDADGVDFLSEALRTDDWSLVVEFATVIEWDPRAAS